MPKRKVTVTTEVKVARRRGVFERVLAFAIAAVSGWFAIQTGLNENYLASGALTPVSIAFFGVAFSRYQSS